MGSCFWKVLLLAAIASTITTSLLSYGEAAALAIEKHNGEIGGNITSEHLNVTHLPKWPQPKSLESHINKLKKIGKLFTKIKEILKEKANVTIIVNGEILWGKGSS